MKSFAARQFATRGVPFGALFLLLLAHCDGDPSEAVSGTDVPDAATDVAADVKKPPRDAGSIAPLPDSLTEKAGTRYEPLYTVEIYEDGARRKVFDGIWYDSQERWRCSFAPLANGSWGCVPIDVTYLQQGFKDAACTEPVLFTTSAADTAAYALWGEPCKSKVGLIATQPSVGSAYTNEDGRCYQRSSKAKLFAEPTPLGDTAFGEFTRTTAASALPTEHSGTRLTVVTDTLTGSDGSFASMNPVVVDAERNIEGAFYLGQDGKHHFLPAARWASESLAFVDDTCAESLVSLGGLPPELCDAPRPLSTNALQHVGNDPRSDCRPVRAVGAPTKPAISTAYLQSSNSCTLMSYPATDAYTRDSFTELPASETPEVTWDIVASDARAVHGEKIEFRAPRSTSVGGFDDTLRFSTPYLREYGVPCDAQLATTPDGPEYRCLPRVATIYASDSNVYADPACKERVLRFETWTMSCDGDPTMYKVADDPDVYAFTVYRRPASRPLDQETYYWLGESGSCTPDRASEGVLYYAVTAEDVVVPATEFPLVTTDYLVP